MTIGLVTPYFPDEQTIDSGIANHFFLLAKSLANAGNDVVVVYVHPSHHQERKDRTDQIASKNVTVVHLRVKVPGIIDFLFNRQWTVIDFALKLRSMLLTSRKLNQIIEQYRIDVIETTSYFSLCYLVKKKIKIPLAIRVSTTFSQILNEHYPFESRLLKLVGKMEIGFIKKSKYLITHTHNHALELNRLYQIEPRKFNIIPHGIGLPMLRKEISDNPTIKILYVGRLEYRKGTDILLGAIPLVLRQHTDVIFELVGCDPNDEYQNQFKSENAEEISKNVIFSGKIDKTDLLKSYQGCDIFVAPSRYESFGLIFIEAMSFGKPVIGCNVGGVSEIISDQYNGLFADGGDAQSLADKIIHLIENPILRRRLAGNARKTVEEKFTAEQLARNSLKYYNQIIADFKSW